MPVPLVGYVPYDKFVYSMFSKTARRSRLCIPALRTRNGALSTLMGAIHSIPRDFSLLTLSCTACLSLKLLDAITYTASSAPVTSSWRRLNASDAFIFDQGLQAIHSKTQTEWSTSPYLIAKLFWDLANATAELTHFFWRATLPLNDHPELLLPVNPLVSCRDHTQSPLVPLPLQGKQWRLFWAFPIYHTSRNIWYWAIRNSLSCQYNLHSRAPTIFVTPNCPICLSEVDTLSHFLYQCPQKWTVWETA
ncbi:hypothetical protein PHYBLDRAFT_59485 [Phycomyces blakesleeanus NRRL 1555(-)]|uniref:Reverse transcriptase zinc-binding domain-containing protein n=1 Tax=Phycomyces blakesleeanus (strain ATCC 8743b / DSM 1359 / FGSC 10004 / NBRC 33097 / NRRL 1555) TaxID=763407 RepID=A0A167NI36_PHYB8|nr:hypothetical protein PHYBLDRAFT_59485 [Phycomyces blakesleeanus NRRL 1555(-)]OAD75958.1 hypothetical protein PHYBLDRAFT_59485 [Phycomyces blakesleeanus NRRL 1555(-)]|eukprot:XP_018293998.1 hypothetical protein PHYBLDRAFT_59485 [Phycomyces blakesleeanus NRRL 1555(-)]